MVDGRDDVVGLDSVGHPAPRRCGRPPGTSRCSPTRSSSRCTRHKRYRADHLDRGVRGEARASAGERARRHPRPRTAAAGPWTEPRNFSGLLKTFLGAVDNEEGLHYLRPETAQGIFVNFANVLGASRMKPPFGIGADRQELPQRDHARATSSSAPASSSRWRWSSSSSPAPTRPGTSTGSTSACDWYTDLGIDPDNLRLYEHPKEKLSHYSKRTVDIEYRFGFQGNEWGELMGIANRTDFDLKTHSEALRHRPVVLRPVDRTSAGRRT